MSNIKKGDIGKDISLTTIEIVMRDQTPNNINENNFIIIVNLHLSVAFWYSLGYSYKKKW